MNIRLKLHRWGRTDRGWPRYMPGGRVRTSTAGLVVAFIALFWVHQVYEPPPQAPQMPESAIVPPGYVPDPNYTWVPRTNVMTQQPEPTEEVTTPEVTTPEVTTSPTAPTTSPGETPTPTGPDDPTPTVVDPDGPGPVPPETVTPAPTTPPPGAPAPAGPVPPATPPQ